MKKLFVLLTIAALCATALAQPAVQTMPKSGNVRSQNAAEDPHKAPPATIKIVCPVAKDTWIYAFRPDSNYGGGYGCPRISRRSGP